MTAGDSGLCPCGYLLFRAGPAAATASAVGLYKLLARQALATVGVDSALSVPVLGVPKVFQGEAVAGREFGFCTLPIAEVKAAAKAQSASVNDVFLAVVDAAMARHVPTYEDERAATPADPPQRDRFQSAANGPGPPAPALRAPDRRWFPLRHSKSPDPEGWSHRGQTLQPPA